jgi:pyridoxal phosphate enzyme (YggS family)
VTDEELHRVLEARVTNVTSRIRRACDLGGPRNVTLIAVTKTVSPRVALAARNCNIENFGESRPQELWKKAAAMPGVRWHFIGHLQRNKLDRTLPLVSLMHSVDSERLLLALDAFGRSRNEPVPILLEVNCSREDAKGGFRPEDVPAFLDKLPSLNGVRVDGLMTMAAYHDDPQHSRPAFLELRNLRDELRIRTGLPLPHLSMGMSNDFEVAVEEGATHVRIGTTLFEGLENE